MVYKIYILNIQNNNTFFKKTRKEKGKKRKGEKNNYVHYTVKESVTFVQM